MIFFDFTYLVTFVFFFLSCCSCNFLNMSKCHSDHFLLFHVIVKKSIEMLLLCNCCFFLNKQCFVSDKSEKYSKCVKSKHSCFFSHFIYATDVSCLFCAYKKLNHNKESVLKKHQKFSTHLTKLNAKILHLKHHQHFLKKHDDKLIQENVKVFEKKLHVLKKKQDFTASSSNSFFDLLIFEINTNTVFSALLNNF